MFFPFFHILCWRDRVEIRSLLLVYCAPAGHDVAVPLRFDSGPIFAQIFALVSASVCVGCWEQAKGVSYSVCCPLSAFWSCLLIRCLIPFCLCLQYPYPQAHKLDRIAGNERLSEQRWCSDLVFPKKSSIFARTLRYSNYLLFDERTECDSRLRVGE